MAIFYSYSFLDTVCAIAGPGGGFPIAGNSSGDADEGIVITFDDDKNTKTMGADGTGMHNLHASQGGTIEITLLKNSPTNQLLQVMYDLQRTTGSLWGQNIITLANTTSGDSYLCNQCAFKKFPDNSYKKDGETMKWGFDVINIAPKIGSGV